MASMWLDPITSHYFIIDPKIEHLEVKEVAEGDEHDVMLTQLHCLWYLVARIVFVNGLN